MNAIDMLKHQHREVEALFKQLHKAKAGEPRRKLFERIADALAVHAAIEERHFYPAVKERATSKQLDLFDLRRRYAALALLVDADYGSATFVDVRSPAVLEVRVSTTGLLVRPKPGAGSP